VKYFQVVLAADIDSGLVKFHPFKLMAQSVHGGYKLAVGQ